MRFHVVCPNCSHSEQGPRRVLGQESPLPEMRARFRGRLGRAGDERFPVAMARKILCGATAVQQVAENLLH